ncbi:ABC transporter ATP-binding protein [Deinococcus cellulosilyticus]|uniref:ABC transporter ATP-binding protein n=1 Tax=Deinococcus cellulosilyticus (strain DSM 18568 / NBRC 106333 / KACC 11606 / 5516J-15) TaxID=1223518 RepID=A0A511MWJ9_DEIC1|nr:ABC transporter ATP-binding protein [Deinococcus cellulosilyticus]GEM44949.1 ABC transporter ATP-binding protein [Deinococcus cellulosilyticus NBRC 106333 = KACC 11606]
MNLQRFKERSRLFYRSYRLIFQSMPAAAALLLLLMVLQGSLPAVVTYLSKITLDVLLHLSDQSSAQIMQVMVFWGASVLLGQILEPWSSYLIAHMNEHTTAFINRKLVQKANGFQGLEPFENALFYQDLEVLNKLSSHKPLNLLVATIHWVRLLTTILGLLLLVGALVWWMPLLLVACSLPGVFKNNALRASGWKGLLSVRKEALEINYFRSLLTQENSAREIRIYGLGQHFENRLMGAFATLQQVMGKERLKLARDPIFTLLLSAAAAIFSFGYVLQMAVQKKVSAGSLVIVVQALSQLQNLLDDFTLYCSLLTEHILYFEKLFHFMDHEEPLRVPVQPQPVPEVMKEGIHFDRVGFSYPDGRTVLKDVTFSIRPGETIALVGENGAGKSTLIKLLCRFHDPTSGSITVDGTDLKQLDLQAWRGRMGAVFQDFVKYHLTVQENIMLGDLGCTDEEMARKAAENSGLKTEILPSGMHTLLGKSFGGTELSGGQWQKLAIARAFFRNPDLLILDEPTAAIDPRAEHDLYEQFARLADGKTVVLVTHRLASVQMADRILVLKEGQLIEQGTHEELLALGGEYATMFRLQARAYQFASEMEEAIGA